MYIINISLRIPNYKNAYIYGVYSSFYYLLIVTHNINQIIIICTPINELFIQNIRKIFASTPYHTYIPMCAKKNCIKLICTYNSVMCRYVDIISCIMSIWNKVLFKKYKIGTHCILFYIYLF